MSPIDQVHAEKSRGTPTPRRPVAARYGLSTIPVRVAGAALLAAMAGIHVHLLGVGYAQLAVGPSFLLNGILGSLAAAALLLVPRRWLAVTSLVGGVLLAGTLGALLLTLTVGLFGFTETTAAPLIGWTMAVESAGAVLLVIAAIAYGRNQARAWFAKHHGSRQTGAAR